MYRILLFIFVLIQLLSTSESNLFGSRTEYKEAQDFMDSPLNENKQSLKLRRYTNKLFPHFDVVALTSFSRHGSRSHTRPNIDSINNFCSKNKIILKNMKNHCSSHWNSSFNANLTKTGKNVEFTRGMWFRSTFGHILLNSDHENKSLDIIVSPKQRALDSYEAFFEGLNTTLEMKYHVDNKLVRFYDNCKKLHKKHKSEYLRRIIDNLSKDPLVIPILGRLSHVLNCTVSLNEAVLLYDHCFSERNNFQDTRFCYLFPFTDEIRIIEAIHDIKRFWKSGRGFDVNYLTACILFEKMYGFLQSHIEHKFKSEFKSSKALFVFGHAEGLYPLESLLGFFDGDYENYLNSNIKEIIKNGFLARSAIPYSGNIAFILLKKNKSDVKEDYSDFGVVVLLNEFAIKVPFCKHVVCKWNEFVEYRKIIKQKTHDCDIHHLCTNN